MTVDNFKPGAKCRFYQNCQIYNNDVLKADIEIKMCGRSLPVDEKYKPKIHEPTIFKPVENYDWPDQPGGTCDAFDYFIECEVIADVVSHLHDVKKLFYKRGHW